MQTSRRKWLKQIGIGVAGISLAPFQTFASQLPKSFRVNPEAGTIRLNLNESAYGASPAARLAMAEAVNYSNRYSRELTAKLVSAVAQHNEVSQTNILLSAGSAEMIDLVVRLAASQKGNFILAAPTFNYWADTAQRLGLEKIAIPLIADKRHDLSAMLKAITPETRLVYVCNPNNPTATISDSDALTAFIKEATKKTRVLVDEVYIDFTDQESLAKLVTDNNNLIVIKTFSKIHGLAGARVGYAVAHKTTIEQLSQFQSMTNGNVGVVSVAGALASLSDKSFTKEVRSLNDKARKFTQEQLQRLNITCIPSYTSFLYFSLANYKKDYFEQLKKNNILGGRVYEEQGKWSRITVGTLQEMQQFVAAVG